jgi:hypothetical protein
MMEARVAAQASGWSVLLTPPAGLALPPIVFADGSNQLDDAGRAATLDAAWAARRWNWEGLAVPGLTEPAPAHPTLLQRRAAAIAAVLRERGLLVVPGPLVRGGGPIRLSPAPTSEPAGEGTR